MIYIYNPQSAMYSQSIWGKIIKKNEHDKLGYILEIARENPSYYKFISDGLVSSFPLFSYIPTKILRKAFSYFEFILWCKINAVPYQLIKRDISKSDIIFSMIAKSSVLCTDSYKESLLFKAPAKKVIHMSHFFEYVDKTSKRAKDCSVLYTCAEAPLKKSSSFYNEYFSFIRENIFIPFYLRDKYKNSVRIDLRENKCLAIGTTHSMNISDSNRSFQKYFKINSWHKMRRIIYENREEYNNTIVCKISDFHKDENLKTSSGFFNKLYNLLFGHKQSNYMSFDIVEVYNSYRMFVSPEEEVGIPSINTIEGMACGCLYFGSHEEIYKAYGLEAGIHYVLYEKNNISDLASKIKYYQLNEKESFKIAKKGSEFVLSTFDKNTVKKQFRNSLEIL